MFDANIKFKYPWRPYQARTLEQVEKYIHDKKIHIVAAPGSGKTILGLELARFLNQPAIIFSPTVTIKNQWIDRFISSFTNFDSVPDWISSNIYDLNFFNVATYQALHYAYKKKKYKNDLDENETDDLIEDVDNQISSEQIETYDIVKELKKQNIKTIVLDEAHHLKSEWWNSLKAVLSELPDITIISLTATPPYDSEAGEWNKYVSLCGAIDAEINVPELVKAKNLCPHQDYVYFSTPTKDDQQKINEYSSSLKIIIDEIKNDPIFLEMISLHRFIVFPNDFQEEILDNVEFYSSMLIFLHSKGKELAKEHTNLIGASTKIPSLTLEWFEILIKNILITERKDFSSYSGFLNTLEQKFESLGAFEKNEFSFSDNSTLEKYFLNSIGKLDSISKILKIEYESLKENLRMVVLTDFIRKEYLTPENGKFDKMGVIPIFKKLYTDYPQINMAVLTGSLFIIPKSLQEDLITLCNNENISNDKISFKELEINSNYSEVKISNTIRNQVMNLICNLFSTGKINIIIGTKSLLGEGWDEPSINTLVLATFVGSFMLSNQMRGRAIRVNKDSKKAANIWHLACVSNATSEDSILNSDYNLLKRRFKAFPGLSYDSLEITSDFERLGNISEPFTAEKINNINNIMKEKAINRGKMFDDWFIATKQDVSASTLISKFELATNFKMEKEWFNKKKYIKQLLLLLLFIFITFVVPPKFKKLFLIIDIVAGTYSALQYLSLFIKTRRKKILKNIGEIVLKSLCECKVIKTPRTKIKLISRCIKDEKLVAYISGATLKESKVFENSLKEVFSKTVNQRYIISKVGGKSGEIISYFNVPAILSTNKDNANIFSKHWKSKFGKHQLIYTRTPEGRKKILKVRMKNISVFK